MSFTEKSTKILMDFGVAEYYAYNISKFILKHIKNKAYHNHIHIINMLDLDKELNFSIEEKIAILFHDVIYHPRRKDPENVLSSARYMKELLTSFSDNETIERISYIIMQTDYSNNETQNSKIMIADLYWLSSENFEDIKQIDSLIRLEHAHLKESDWKKSRKSSLNKIKKLQPFTGDLLYKNDIFKKNIQRLIDERYS